MITWKAAGHRLKKLRQLSPSDRRVLIEALVWLPATGAALRVLGYHRVHAFLTRLPLSAASDNSVSDSAVRKARAAARMVKAAIGHGLYRATCLPESLVLWSLLSRRGLPVELHIGTRMDCKQLKAHAWVEIQGTVINDADDVHKRYASFEQNILAVRTKAP
jgi:hypothetical protein